VTDAKGVERDAQVLAHDADNDVAVLQVFGAQWPSCLRLANGEAGLGAEVFTVGFPQTEILGVKPKLATGVISSRFGMRDDPRTYQISVPVQAGNSGGPLLNMQGEVVGVVAAKLNAAQVFDWTGDLPQNVNYAVKSKPLLQLVGAVKNAKIVLGTGAETLAPQVEMAVVLIRVKLYPKQ
jgi:S1-C subfamily serine protease